MKEKEVHGIFKQKEVLEVDCFCFKNNGNDILFQGENEVLLPADETEIEQTFR
jgi:hypothetical protein